LTGICSAEEQTAVEDHCRKCGNCRQRIESMRTDMGVCDRANPAAVQNRPGDDFTRTMPLNRDEQAAAPPATGTASFSDTHPGGNGFKSTFEGYRIIEAVGEGGMGTVWRALQLSTQREVALKVLSAGSFRTQKFRARFEREVELTAQLAHPNIARVYDSGLHRGMYYYTMELLDGEHLDKYVADHGMTQRQVLELIHKVCQGVQYAHQRGVIHRDLKPSNIVVTSDGEPHILDFGLAKALLQDDKTVTVSVDGDVAGTPAYMSPEQAGGHLDAIDTRSDVYSLGVILFNLLTGQWPYDLSGSRFEVLKRIQEEEPVRPSKIVPHFDADIEAILLKALAKKSDERYQSVAELAHDIRSWLEGLPIIARSVDIVYLLKKYIARNRTAAVIVCLVFVIIVNFSFVSLYLYRQKDRALEELQAGQDAYKQRAEMFTTGANRVVFILFLELWHDDKVARAHETAIHLTRESRESLAAMFLLDPRGLGEKQADFEAKFSAHQAWFWEFVKGEYYLKNKDKQAAVEAYERCLDGHQDASQSDDWFKNRARAKLAELQNRPVPLILCPDVNSTEGFNGN
jgi:serine/threonine protein kinase